MSSPTTIVQYITGFDGETKKRLAVLYKTIKSEIPEAEESISYGLPTFKIHASPVIYFGGFKNHIGLYATPDGHAEFEEELSKYKRGKGSVQFPHDLSLPLDLVRRITRYRYDQIQK
jgi:uncharacterized protein YdhG (YjbR/CyaY superfamily)